jgi:hypothetical protein
MAIDTLVVTPAYGRKYSTKEQAIKDWEAGKDFRAFSTKQYLSIRDVNTLRKELYLGISVILSTGDFAYISIL